MSKPKGQRKHVEDMSLEEYRGHSDPCVLCGWKMNVGYLSGCIKISACSNPACYCYNADLEPRQVKP